MLFYSQTDAQRTKVNGLYFSNDKIYRSGITIISYTMLSITIIYRSNDFMGTFDLGIFKHCTLMVVKFCD